VLEILHFSTSALVEKCSISRCFVVVQVWKIVTGSRYVLYAIWLYYILHGPMENVMDVIYTTNKGRFLDTSKMERFYIYKETRNNNQINDKKTPRNQTWYLKSYLGKIPVGSTPLRNYEPPHRHFSLESRVHINTLNWRMAVYTVSNRTCIIIL